LECCEYGTSFEQINLLVLAFNLEKGWIAIPQFYEVDLRFFCIFMYEISFLIHKPTHYESKN